MLFIFYVVQTLSVLISVAFVTLLERKILGFMQGRLGPNKIFIKGGLQSLGDALKLAGKGLSDMFTSQWLEYNLMPSGMMVIMLLLWGIMPSFYAGVSSDLLLILCIISLGVYPIMFGGWFSGSYYSMLGAVRSISQMISYEVSMIIILMNFILFNKSFSLMDLFEYSLGLSFVLFSHIFIMMFSSILIELNRTPIDLIEGESELVSGFNTEYYGFKFALIFLSEYGMIIFMSNFLVILFIGSILGSVSWGMFTMGFIFLVIWIRGILPRIRYDVLMYLCWNSMLNLSLGVLSFIIGVNLLFDIV